MTKNKLAIVLVISILINGLVLSCGRADKAANLDEIETTTFAIAETTDTIQESSHKHSESEASTSAAINTIKTERLEGSSQLTTQAIRESANPKSGEQNNDTTSTTVIGITEANTTSAENATTITDIESTQANVTVPNTQKTSAKTTPTTAPTPTAAPDFYNRVDIATFIKQAFSEVNRMRAEVGQDPVVMAPKLVQDYAILRAKEEGQDETGLNFDHIRPNGEWALDYLDLLYYDGSIDKQAISENITAVSALSSYSHYGDGMVRKFQSSASHYSSIISSDSGFVGIGYYYNEKAWLPYIVLIFLEK